MYVEPTNSVPNQQASAPRRCGGARRPQQTPLARRRRLNRMVRDLARETGITAPSTAERATLEQAATLALRMADLRAAIVGGETIEGDELIRISGEQRRLLAQLRKRAPQPSAPTLRERLAAEAAEAAEKGA